MSPLEKVEKKKFKETHKEILEEQIRELELDVEAFIGRYPRFWEELSKND